VNACFSSTTLFRRNSLASKLVTSCMKRFGQKYLETLLKEMIQKIVKEDENLEVDPMRDPNVNVEENMKILIKMADTLLERLFSTVDYLP
jgi:uncharacterized protein YaaW (UPF0174 family)